MAAAKKTTESTPKGSTPRETAINKARADANSEILAKYKTERDGLIVDKVKAAGFDWAPAPTAEQKAAAQLEELYTKFPNLRPAAPVVTGEG